MVNSSCLLPSNISSDILILQSIWKSYNRYYVSLFWQCHKHCILFIKVFPLVKWCHNYLYTRTLFIWWNCAYWTFSEMRKNGMYTWVVEDNDGLDRPSELSPEIISMMVIKNARRLSLVLCVLCVLIQNCANQGKNVYYY